MAVGARFDDYISNDVLRERFISFVASVVSRSESYSSAHYAPIDFSERARVARKLDRSRRLSRPKFRLLSTFFLNQSILNRLAWLFGGIVV
jgi:hypothetical protein